ncbi:hypothetical protein [Xylella fastidiosa]|uniref:hypothetical protein n=1 Tax=Xylella fastidiosa TaxID=2371 RepID=UPI003AFAD731
MRHLVGLAEQHIHVTDDPALIFLATEQVGAAHPRGRAGIFAVSSLTRQYDPHHGILESIQRANTKPDDGTWANTSSLMGGLSTSPPIESRAPCSHCCAHATCIPASASLVADNLPGSNAVTYKVTPIQALIHEELARPTAAKTSTAAEMRDGEQMLGGDGKSGHFLPPFVLIGIVPCIFQARMNSSPTQTVPK